MSAETGRKSRRPWVLGRHSQRTGYNSTYSGKDFAAKKTVAVAFSDTLSPVKKYSGTNSRALTEMSVRMDALANRSLEVWLLWCCRSTLIAACRPAGKRSGGGRDVTKIKMEVPLGAFERFGRRVWRSTVKYSNAAEPNLIVSGPPFFLEILPRRTLTRCLPWTQ